MEDFGQCYCQSKTVECLFFFCNFESPMKSFSINFNCWSFVFTRKYSGEKSFGFHLCFSRANMVECPQNSEFTFLCIWKELDFTVTYFLKVGASPFSGPISVTNLKFEKSWKIMKIEDFHISDWKQILWSPLDFFQSPLLDFFNLRFK